MIIKLANDADLEKIAECHISAFPKSLSSALGKRYVTRMLGWYLSSDQTFLFFGEEQDRVVGYCGGMIKRSGVTMGSASSMAQFSFNVAVRSLLLRPWLVFHQELRAKYLFIWKNFKKRFEKKQRKVVTNGPGVADQYVGLVVIGVQHDLQGRGIGSKLLQEFEITTSRLGHKKMMLTVLTENLQAIASYERNGWEKEVVNGKSTTMVKYL